MKIIKEGHNENRMRVTCSNCEAELELQAEDFEVWPDLFSCTCLCPCCKVPINFNTNQVTRGVRNLLIL